MSRTITTTRSPAATGTGAGRTAVGDAVAGAVGGVDDPGLVLVLAGADLPGAVAQADAAAGAAPVAGMTASGTITQAGPHAVDCVAMAFDASVASGVGVAADASRNPSTAAERATRASLSDVPADAPYKLVVLFVDPGSGDQADVVAGAYRAAGPHIPLVGGGAGGPRPALYARGGRWSDAVVAVAIGSERPIGVGMADGCRPVGVPSIVTRAQGRLLIELDGRPAEEVYREKLGAPESPGSDADFERLAVLHPLAQPELSGTRRLRHVLRRVPRGALYCATSVPPNAAVEFTAQDRALVVDSSRDAVREALSPLGARPAAAALVFDCAGRRSALEGDVSEEVEAIRSSFGGTPALAGAYTRGEIARYRGAKGDRNHALVVVAFA